MLIAHIPESDFEKSGQQCPKCQAQSDLSLNFVASRKFPRVVRGGQVQPPIFSTEVRERLDSIYCEVCDALWQIVPDVEIETEKAPVAARQELARRDQLMDSPAVPQTVIH